MGPKRRIRRIQQPDHITHLKKKWRKLSGTNRLHEIIQGVEFKDRIKQLQNAARLDRHQLLGITPKNSNKGQ
tara:strand:+ start:937 stop:1152 length:216 start_codon:yes stop_codon:yes gene_type:complete